MNMDQDNGEQNIREEEPGLEAALVPVFAKALVEAVPEELRILTSRINKDQVMAPYTCWHCKEYVRGGVIIICGHMFCWSCLWPFLADSPSPECPQCQTALILHEDIMPFYGEGPNAKPEESDFLAEPGAVPRPSGVCFNGPDEDDSDDQDVVVVEEIVGPLDVEPLIQAHEAELVHVILSFSRIKRTVIFLKRLQVICAILMIFLLFFVSLT